MLPSRQPSILTSLLATHHEELCGIFYLSQSNKMPSQQTHFDHMTSSTTTRGVSVAAVCVVWLLLLICTVFEVQGTTSTTYSQTQTEGEIISLEESLMNNQEEALKKMRCRPVPTFLPLTELVHYSDLPDHFDFYPEVLVVSRCQGFCGNERTGYSNEDVMCKPAGVNGGVTKRSVVIYEHVRGRKVFKLLTVTEHITCECVCDS
ncbi:hypothetical protein Pcinc_027477 [Petrolisthes cinctipes]|uniref:Platelet-derived growth factor (PDGF) family profile domain-containing protein n=1 Tax=Petrolisthes cinctipes TaxID=88211 RepID=A0AAE1F4A8_PETCI|nr:hypothetical protein Pcinc_027477 [Petrolisthes cinctipes]